MSLRWHPFHGPTIDADKWVLGMSGFKSPEDARRDFEDRYHSLRTNSNSPEVYEEVGRAVIKAWFRLPYGDMLDMLAGKLDMGAWLRSLCAHTVDGKAKKK